MYLDTVEDGGIGIWDCLIYRTQSTFCSFRVVGRYSFCTCQIKYVLFRLCIISINCNLESTHIWEEMYIKYRWTIDTTPTTTCRIIIEVWVDTHMDNYY